MSVGSTTASDVCGVTEIPSSCICGKSICSGRGVKGRAGV